MVRKSISFGLRHGAPASLAKINVRECPLSLYDRQRCKLNGLHADVQADIEKTPGFDGLVAF